MDYPIFGVGPSNARYRLGEYQPRDAVGDLFSTPAFYDRDWSGTAIHSLYFELLAERGIVGVALFASIVVLHFKTLRRLRRAAARGTLKGSDLRREGAAFSLALEASMAGFLASAAFLSMATYPYFWFLSAQATALERALHRENAWRSLKRSQPAIRRT
jgi:O-antigen ligase